MPLAPALYIVATPIGNLGDMTFRAVETLKEADIIYCEDTRVTAKLLSAYDIRTPTRAYHDHNADRTRPEVLAALQEGKAVALVSDAGTPLISDPGYKLVRDARAAGYEVVAVPGASALTAAASIAGLATDRLLFAGFPPAKQGARRAFFEEFKTTPATLVFYETGPRLAASLADMAEALGPREAVVARELTKKFEEVRIGALPALAAAIAEDGAPKGEIVVLVARGEKQAASESDVDAMLLEALKDAPLKEAAALVSAATGLPRRALYTRGLVLKRKTDP